MQNHPFKHPAEKNDPTMKRPALLLLFVVCHGLAALAQGIEFFHGTWAEALEEARRQEKIIFVDAYAQWCGPCKRMARNVFPQEEVGAFFNKHFINVKMDMEHGEGPAFGQKYPVSAYPTLFFIDYTGEVVLQVRGARDAEGLIELGRKALGMVDRSAQYAARYEQGDRSPELVYQYIKALNQAGKPSLAIANEYLRAHQRELDKEENLRILFEALVQADSRIFDLFVQHQSRLEALFGSEAVRRRIEEACKRTLETAMEYDSEALLEEAKDKMKAHCPAAAAAFAAEADWQFWRASTNDKAACKAARQYARTFAADARALDRLAQDIILHRAESVQCLKVAEKSAHRAVALEPDYYGYHYTLTRVLEAQGRTEEAAEAARTGLKVAQQTDAGPAAEALFKRFLQQIGRAQ